MQRRYQLHVSRYRLIEKNAHAGHAAHAAAQRATISGVRPSAASGPVSVRFPTRSRRRQPPLPLVFRQSSIPQAARWFVLPQRPAGAFMMACSAALGLGGGGRLCSMAPRPNVGAALACQAGDSPFSGEHVLDQWHLWVIFEGVKAAQRGQLSHSAWHWRNWLPNAPIRFALFGPGPLPLPGSVNIVTSFDRCPERLADHA